jgi:hypothetical protein
MRRLDQRAVSTDGPCHGRRQRRRLQQTVRDGALIFDSEADQTGLLDRLLRHPDGGVDKEVAQTPPLQLGGSLHDGERLRRDPRLDARRTAGILGHDIFLVYREKMYGNLPDK